MRLDLDPCVEHDGYRNDRGYGVTHRSGRSVKAHREAWELVNGPIPDGLCVCHHCDNPACVNVNHLFLGTRADNNRDRAMKGRTQTQFVAGERHPALKITSAMRVEIRQMRSTGSAQRLIAERFGISRGHVAHLTRGVLPPNTRGEA